MRVRLLTILFVALLPLGCASGFRVGGDRYGVGAGGYVGPVPPAATQNAYLLPPVGP